MALTSLPLLLLVLAAGFALGLAFFASLWFTVRRLPGSANPIPLLLLGGLLRLVGSLVVMALLAAGDWQRLLAALLGFVLARILLVRLWGPAAGPAGDVPFSSG
jgi:F1F0 ATPase subunit 2